MPNDLPSPDKGMRLLPARTRRDTKAKPPARQIDADTLIERISNGAFLRDLAKETGIDKRRLSEQLRKHPAYQAAKETSIEVQLDDAQKAIEAAREQTDIARAREAFRAAAWRAEREFPARWGQRSHVTIENVGDLADRLRRARERVIDVTPEAENPLESVEGDNPAVE